MSFIVQPDGSRWYKRRGPPPEPTPGYVRSTDPYVLILAPCTHREDRTEKVSCCLANRIYCKKQSIYVTNCLGCPLRE